MDHYPHIEFARYEYSHYPLWVTLPDGSQKIVHDEDEEAAVLAGARTAAEAEDERAALLQAADVRGLKVDKRWSTERVRAALEAGKGAGEAGYNVQHDVKIADKDSAYARAMDCPLVANTRS